MVTEYCAMGPEGQRTKLLGRKNTGTYKERN